MKDEAGKGRETIGIPGGGGEAGDSRLELVVRASACEGRGRGGSNNTAVLLSDIADTLQW